MVAREKIVAIALAVIMVTAAGCAGLGTDEPADGSDSDESDSGQSDDLEEANEETQPDETDDGTESDTVEESDDSGAGDGSEGGSGTESDADTDSESDTDTDGADGDEEESSDADDDDSGISDGDSDEEANDDNGEMDDDESSGDDNADEDDEDDGDEHRTLTITVEDESGEPVEDMLVVGTGPNDQQHDDRTDENGQVTFDLPDGDYSWVTDTEGTGYEGDKTSITMDGSDESITMTVTPETSDLTVTVTDHDGNPLSNATVSVVTDPDTDGGEDVDSATTNESGVAEFAVEHGTYAIAASHEEYSADGTAGPIDVTQGNESIDVMMPEPDDDGNDDGNETDNNETETHTLTVRTPGAPDGTAITVQREAGPDEEEPDPITKASAGGQASFNVPSGHYHAEAEEYNPTMVAVEVSDDREITLQQPDPDPIEVTVVDAETDEPIEGAEISGICDLWYSSGDVYVEGTTDANGIAEATTGVAPTECDARVEADGYETTHLPLSVPDDDGITVEMTPAPADDEGADSSADDDSDTTVRAIAL